MDNIITATFNEYKTKLHRYRFLTASSGRTQEAITVSMHSSILQILNLEKQNTRSQSPSGQDQSQTQIL